MEARFKVDPLTLGDIAALLKPGIVASNVFTSLAGWSLALGMGPAPRLWATPLACALTAIGTAALVAGSCALNNWIDRDIDALMARTSSRPTATGKIGKGLALATGFGLVATGALLFLLFAGPVPALVGLAGVFAYVVPYTLWAKRRGGFSSLVGGVSGAIPPLIGWAVVDPSLGGPAPLLFVFLVVWQQAHVRALALKREGDYRRAEIPMAGIEGRLTGELSRRTRWALIGWILVLLPFPALVVLAAPGPGGLLFAIAECIATALWLGSAVAFSRPAAGLRSGAWGRTMFFASLGHLVLFFAGLMALGLFRSIAR
jgi:protoheme IX farnesyltransferase